MSGPKIDGSKFGKETEHVTKYGKRYNFKHLNENGAEATNVAYVTESDTKLPKEILVTGNVQVLDKYIKDNPQGLSEDSVDMKHIAERLEIMNYFNELSEYNNNNEPESISKDADQELLFDPVLFFDKESGKYFSANEVVNKIPGLELDRKQTSANGCWACAIQMLLKAQGVDLDQNLIKRFRPDYEKYGEGPINPEIIDVANGDKENTIQENAEIIGKVCPNTIVRTLNLQDNLNRSVNLEPEDRHKIKFSFLRQIYDQVKNNNPVSINTSNHWLTVVGADERNFYVINSNQDDPHVLNAIPVENLLYANKMEVSWLEKMNVNETGEIEGIDPAIAKIDKDSGFVLDGESTESAKLSSDWKNHGNFLVSKMESADEGVELYSTVYIPEYYRDYSKDFRTQMEQVKELRNIKAIQEDKYAEKLPEEGSYTFMEAHNMESTVKSFQNEHKTKTEPKPEEEKNVDFDAAASIPRQDIYSRSLDHLTALNVLFTEAAKDHPGMYRRQLAELHNCLQPALEYIHNCPKEMTMDNLKDMRLRVQVFANSANKLCRKYPAFKDQIGIDYINDLSDSYIYSTESFKMNKETAEVEPETVADFTELKGIEARDQAQVMLESSAYILNRYIKDDKVPDAEEYAFKREVANLAICNQFIEQYDKGGESTLPNINKINKLIDVVVDSKVLDTLIKEGEFVESIKTLNGSEGFKNTQEFKTVIEKISKQCYREQLTKNKQEHKVLDDNIIKQNDLELVR